MTIFDHISKSDYYLNVCMKFTRNHDAAYDLMMDTALKIHNKGYDLSHVKSLFYTIAVRDYMKRAKNYDLIEDLLSDREVGKYQRDMIDCALALLEESPKTKRDFVTLGIFKLFLKHGKKTEVEKQTRINRKVVEHHVNKFVRYVYENCRMFDN